ncbi:amidohydrolase family protein, partial [Pseudophaeobacter sp.]|uniref:amidohydrolase family protein n=1 Tax=Pseudophaeobacter sp. TaxID=1971739 RepID=UPI003299003A
GSASNDMANLMGEARQTLLLQRVSQGADAMSAYEALQIATRGGADVLGRPDCGRLAPGKRADLAIWDVSGVASSGSWDPAALLLAGPSQVKHLFVEGRQIVQDGHVTTLDLPRLLERHHGLAKRLISGE